MKKIFIFSLLLLLPFLAWCAPQKQVYIVSFGKDVNGGKALHEIEETHHSYLLSVKANEEEARDSLLYSYKHSINGFAAVLTPDESSKLSAMKDVASVYASKPEKYSLHTTRSWEFIGLDEDQKYTWNHFKTGGDLLSKAKFGEDVIVGIVDSGVWPESKSFSDEGMGPVPKSWKGICQNGVGFNSSNCNKKIIGARYYLKGYEYHNGPLNPTQDYRSPRDLNGHGTHTASIVAGRRVSHASALGGLARGTASGGAPFARLAIYKACWPIPSASKIGGNTCTEEDLLAAIDDAINDGVHVLSLSIGSNRPLAYTEDGIAMGALNAARKNIVVACSAGNSGPTPATVSNPAPWIITVGASSIDRDFIGSVVLGNGMEIVGKTYTPYKLEKMNPLVYAGDAAIPGSLPPNELAQCLPNSLSPEKVKGKIVLCNRGMGFRVLKGMEVKRAGGAGYILGNNRSAGNDVSSDAHFLPATAVTYNDAVKIHGYIKSTNNPMAMIQKARTVMHPQPAPFMAGFSSRGPSPVDTSILKPDITAPGLNILAAWSEGSSPTKFELDKRTVKFNIVSGTSMSCPHVAAAAALLKAIHPDWSSAVIRSALMTTASLTNDQGLPITNQEDGSTAIPFSFGSGHFDPTKAADPGLVYDASYEDYLLYLCRIGYTYIDPSFECPENPPSSINLNYPSLAIPNLYGTVTVMRTVTNVGSRRSAYSFTAEQPLGVYMTAYPSTLVFDHIGQKKSFTITVNATRHILRQNLRNQYVFGSYSWSDGIHHVRSPIAVSFA